MLARLPGGFNATDLTQMVYNGLVSATSCAETVGTPESIDCLRKVPFEEIDSVLASGQIGDLPSVWPPVLDGDFFQDYTANQLHSGNFVQVPLLTGTNSDEGTGFGMGRGPNGGPINTDEEFAAALLEVLMNENTENTAEELAAELMELYPNDQSVGIPSLETWGHIIQPGDPYAQQLGAQFRRISSVVGDYMMHYLRRRANLVWSSHDVPSYAYRFDVVPNGIEDFIGAVHFQEVSDGSGLYGDNGYGSLTVRYFRLLSCSLTSMAMAMKSTRLGETMRRTSHNRKMCPRL
jgi:carboxylesterase type B